MIFLKISKDSGGRWSEDGGKMNVRVDDKLEFMGIEEFKERIVRNKGCFICGSPRKMKGVSAEEAKTFNGEHIIPQWLIRRCHLEDERVLLPDGRKIPYIKYVIPCCEECNERLGRKIENPVSRLFFKGNDEVLEKPLRKEIETMLFTWLSLIFIKTHLWDGSLEELLTDDSYDWEGIYNIWRTARSILEKPKEDHQGSLMILECEDTPHFAYKDNLTNKTIMLKIDKICLIAVLDDRGDSETLLNNNEMIEVFSCLKHIRQNQSI